MQAYTAARLPHVESKETMRLCAQTITRLIGNLEPRMLARSFYTTARHAASVSGISAGAIRREITVLRAALSWALRERWITEAPYVEMPRRPSPRDRWLTRDEVRAILDNARSQHIRLFVVLAYHTAARTGAILELTWGRVDFDQRLIRYARPGRRETKKRRATVPINTPLLADLQAAYMVRLSDYVIEYHGRKVNSIKTGFRRACREAGIEDCSPHVLRHTAASHMMMERVPLTVIARTLGDTVETVERVYGHHHPDFLREGVDALAQSATKSDLSRIQPTKNEQNRHTNRREQSKKH